MPESIPLQPRAAVLRLIALRRAGRSLPKDFPDPGAGAEQLVEALRRVGLAARVVKAEAKDLPCLDCPTLVEARGGGWFMLLAAARGRIRLEGAEGAISGDAAGLLGDTALDLSPLLPAARTFWGRIGRQLLGSRQDLLFLVRTSLFSQALALAVPAATLLVLDRALPDAAQSLLALTAGGIAVITLFQAWTGWLRQRAVLYLETVLEVSAQRTLVEHILNLPYPVLARTSRADLLQAFYGLENARTLMTGVALGAVLDGLFVLVYPACLVLLFPTAAALVILATLAEAALTLGIGRFLMRIQHQTKDDWERLLAAARESGLDDWVRTLPMGYDSLVPPGGGNMSGGQRQMVALAAVMATPRRILLLDEAMANLDGLRQRRVRESPWIRGKTILYASHAGGFHGEFIEISSV